MKKIINFFLCLILTLTFFTININANFNNDPEIKDEIADTILRYIDILSVWFNENPYEPEYLYIKMEIRDLSRSWIGGLYQIEWTYNDIIYSSFASIGYKGSSIPNGLICGEYGRGTNNDLFNMKSCEGNIDIETGLITWRIPKINIGNPKGGDVLRDPWSKSCFSGIYGVLSFLRYIPILAKDLAPTYLDEDDLSRFEYGRDYIIKY